VRQQQYRLQNRSIIGQDSGALLLVSVLLFVVLFWRLGAPTFWDPDEAHYAETTHEMIATGDWWAPFYNEQPFFDKPMLFHQIQGVGMLVFGQNELGARVAPAMAALVLILITYWFAASTLSVDVAIVAAILLAASPGVFGLARYAILDTLFTMFLFGGSALLAVAALNDRPRLQWGGYLAIAGAVLIKGPLALALCGLTLLIAAAFSVDLRLRLFGLRWVMGVALVVAVSAPWFVYMFLRFRQAFVDGYILDENVRLFAASRFGNQPHFWFYFQILAAGLLPWTGLLLGRIADDVRAVWRGEKLDAVETLLWAWTIAIVGFFTASTFKLDHYVFPAAPALCLICARAFVDCRVRHGDDRHRFARFGLLTIGPLLVAVGLGCGYFLIARLDLPRMAFVVPILLTIGGAVLTARVNVRGGRPPRVPWIVSGAMLIVYASVIVWVMPALEQHKVVDDVARWVAARAAAGDRVASYRLNRWTPSFRFYVGRHATFLEDAHEAAAFFARPEPYYCVMRREAYDEFVASGVKFTLLLEQEGMSATTGRVLWRNQIPTARFVVVANRER